MRNELANVGRIIEQASNFRNINVSKVSKIAAETIQASVPERGSGARFGVTEGELDQMRLLI